MDFAQRPGSGFGLLRAYERILHEISDNFLARELSKFSAREATNGLRTLYKTKKLLSYNAYLFGMARKKASKAAKPDKDIEVEESKAPEKRPENVAPAPKPKPKTALERRKEQIDGIIKTVYPAALGVILGFVSYYFMASINQYGFPWHFMLLVIILITYIIQKFTYPFLGIDSTAFQGKDWFYVEFMAIDLWLVTWTILLN